MAAAPLSHAGGFLREADRDRYLASLILAEPARGAVQALYAFSADVATVRDRVREPAPGEMRLQWWADALSGSGHGEVRQNPLAAALLDVIARYGLPAGPLLRLIEARRFDLYQDPMPDLPSFEGYAGETASILYQLAAMILAGGEELENGDAAGHLGVAHALVGHLRSFGFNAAQGRIFLPWSILSANGVTEAEVLSGTPSEGLAEALGQLHETAAEHLRKAGAALARVPVGLRPAYATLPLLERQLRALARQADAPFAPPSDFADWRKLAIMAWWAFRQARR